MDLLKRGNRKRRDLVVTELNKNVRDGPFDIQGGWDFFEKNSLFPYRREKNNMCSAKLKIKVCSSFCQFFRSPFPSEL